MFLFSLGLLSFAKKGTSDAAELKKDPQKKIYIYKILNMVVSIPTRKL